MKKLVDIIKQGESEILEFKERFNTDVIETAVAFANTRGGRVVIGLSDSGRLIAQDFSKEALRDYVNWIATATEPSVIPEAEKLVTPQGEVIVLSITEFPLKPLATRGRCYRRAGSATRQMTPSEIAEMHLRSTGQSMDAIIVPGKTKEDIDLERVREYMRQATDLKRRSFLSSETPWQVLKKLELVRDSDKITRAAILLFGKNPQSPLTQAVVHAGRLRDKIHIMDNLIIEGSIIDQVEKTVEFIKKNLHVRFEITGEPQRKEIWDYPLPAIREAVINAICHRDYGHVSDIQIKIMEDALQVWSPGFLPFNLTVSDLFDPTHLMPAKRPSSRNHCLKIFPAAFGLSFP
jgi:ATP-dependent DNA helicase RecG